MTILIAYDGSPAADAAITRAAQLTPDDRQAVVLSVWEPLTAQTLLSQRFASVAPAIVSDAADKDRHSAKGARRLAEHGARLAGEAGFEARALWVADDRTIADTLIEAADELDAGLIVMGSRGLTGLRAAVGSVSTHVLQHSHRPVLVVPVSVKQRSEDTILAGAAGKV